MLLRDVAFAPDTLRCAKAKLDLQFAIDHKIANDALNNPEKALAKCLFAAGLTHIKILTIVFGVESKDTGQYECLKCIKAVNIDSVVYHPRCKIVEWLLEYFFFKYDDQQGALIATRPSYFITSNLVRTFVNWLYFIFLFRFLCYFFLFGY